jgi:hypothetical protein
MPFGEYTIVAGQRPGALDYETMDQEDLRTCDKNVINLLGSSFLPRPEGEVDD